MAASIEALIEALASHETRHRAREALREQLDDAAPQLLEVVKDTERLTNMRWAAITLLAEAKYEEAGPELVRIMKEEQNLRPDALRALEEITGRDDVGVEADDWEKVIAGESLDQGVGEALSDDEAAEFVRSALEGSGIEVGDEDGYVRLTVPLEGERRHQLLLTFDEKDAKGRQLITVYTECGEASEEAQDIIYRHNVTMPYGAFTVDRNANDVRSVVLRHRVPTEEVDPSDMRPMIEAIAREADAVEYELSQQDQI